MTTLLRLSRNLEARDTPGRGAVIYVRATVRGKRIYQSTGLEARPENVAAARTIRDAVLRAAQEERFAELANTKLRQAHPFASIGDLIERYEKVCQVRRDIEPVTVRYNVGALLRILSRTQEKEPDACRALSSEILTDELVEEWAELSVDDGADRVEEESRRRTCNATLRHARGMFKRDLIRQYRGLKVPDFRPFMEAFGCKSPPVQYELPDEALYSKIIAGARTGLRAERPDLYAAFLLVYDLAMRANEAAAARWSWIEQDGPGLVMRIIDRPEEDWKPKGRGGSVPVAPGVLAALEEAAVRRAGDAFILPGGSHGARYELAMQGIADWMRGLGWRRRKCAHELRKLKGSFWRARSGLDRAHEWLRHAQYQVTLDYYARLPTREEPHRID